MASNHGVVYLRPGKVEVQSATFSTTLDHAVAACFP